MYDSDTNYRCLLLRDNFLIQTSLKVDVAASDTEHFNPCIIAKEDTGVGKARDLSDC